MATPELLRQALSQLGDAAACLAAIGAALDVRAAGVALEAGLDANVAEALDAMGLRGAIDALRPVDIQPILGEIRVLALINAKLLFAASRKAGWEHHEPELLEAAGDASAGFPERLKSTIAPMLEGLSERLSSSGAAFLDVGVGVGALSIGMACTWPTLRVVGIDPLREALDIARRSVSAARLDDRIELREQAGQDLTDVSTFDLAWIPSAFVSAEIVSEMLVRVRRALKAGGWLLFPILRAGEDRLARSLAHLRGAMFGGLIIAPEEAKELLRAQGFADVRTLPGPPTALTALVAGRR